MLTQPPKNNVPSLQAGDATRNAALQIAKLIKRVDNMLDPAEDEIQENDVPAPRVKHAPMPIPSKSPNPTRSPTTIPFNSDEISADVLQNHSHLPKNLRFQNQGNHKYNLRSNSPALILDFMFHLKCIANHMWRDDGKK